MDHHAHLAHTLGALTPAAAFVFGLFGSPHCAAMCGPLFGLLSARSTRGQESPARPGPTRDFETIALYHAGRITAYATVGACVAALGLQIQRFAPARGVVGILAGLAVIAAGFGAALPWGRIRPPASLLRLVARAWRVRGAPGRAAALGALHALFPCPTLYTMLLASATLGKPVMGALALAAFGAGTIPATVGVGALAGLARGGRGRALSRAGGAVFALWGLALLGHALSEFTRP
jgi:sulfite exporter TauE/SafE